MIKLFNINNYIVDTSKFSNLLHDNVVSQLEQEFADYVGAKYACSANSASSLIFLSLLQHPQTTIRLPSTIPIVVPNAVTNTNHNIEFYEDIEWVGHYYKLHDDIFDSAQQVNRNIYKELNNNNASMIFSFYPTKPVGGCDGGMIVSNNRDVIDYFKIITMNGTEQAKDSWSREQKMPGYKMHMNSIQAAIALQNLRKLDNKNYHLEKIKGVYNRTFSLNNTSNHLYRIRVKNNKSFIHKMKLLGIQCGIHYEHCHNKQFFNCANQTLPISERESVETVSIPFHERLTEQDIDRIIYAVSTNR